MKLNRSPHAGQQERLARRQADRLGSNHIVTRSNSVGCSTDLQVIRLFTLAAAAPENAGLVLTCAICAVSALAKAHPRMALA
jgi:hypothetical protein